MITPYLEEKIHKGVAQYNTFVLGVSGVSVIPVSRGTYIVITDIYYQPFTNIPENLDTPNTEDILKCINKQLEFRSQKSVNHYVFRDGLPNNVIPQKIDTYLVHQSDVTVNFAVIPSLTDGTMQVNTGLIPVTTDIKEKPTGYGNLTGQVQEALLEAPGQQYLPTGTDNIGIPAASDYRNQLKVDYTDKTRLANLADPIYDDFMKDRAYPILNIGYVFVNEMPNQFLQSS